MLLETLLGHLALVEHQLGHPVALEDAVVGARVVLGANKVGDDGLELVSVRLQRPIPDVHLVGGEADERVQHQRRGQVVVLGQLLGRHTGRGGRHPGTLAAAGDAAARSLHSNCAAPRSVPSCVAAADAMLGWAGWSCGHFSGGQRDSGSLDTCWE